jgi:hypothetical protein
MTIEKVVESLVGQDDAVLAFLRNELELGNLMPFFSAKRQLFPIPS